MDNPHLTEDQKDIRLLADILALILDEEQGQAHTALLTLRQRAKKRKISGGTLKNLFTSLAEHERLTQIQLYEYSTASETLASRHRQLQSEYAFLQEENKQLRYNNSFHKSQAPLRRAALCIALITGLLTGIAGTELVSSLTAPPRVDPATCLH